MVVRLEGKILAFQTCQVFFCLRQTRDLVDAPKALDYKQMYLAKNGIDA